MKKRFYKAVNRLRSFGIKVHAILAANGKVVINGKSFCNLAAALSYLETQVAAETAERRQYNRA